VTSAVDTVKSGNADPAGAQSVQRANTIWSLPSIYPLSMHVRAGWPLLRETISADCKHCIPCCRAQHAETIPSLNRWHVLRCAVSRDRAAAAPHLTAFNSSEGLTDRQSLRIV